MVLAIVMAVLSIGMVAFGAFLRRDSARRAAQIFAQDLVAARSYAVRSQESVVIRFYESSLWYEVTAPASGTEIARRRYGANGELGLDVIDLEAAGDSLVFDVHGVVDMSGSGGALGTARFSSGAESYAVSFNSMGASTIDRT